MRSGGRDRVPAGEARVGDAQRDVGTERVAREHDRLVDEHREQLDRSDDVEPLAQAVVVLAA